MAFWDLNRWCNDMIHHGYWRLEGCRGAAVTHGGSTVSRLLRADGCRIGMDVACCHECFDDPLPSYYFGLLIFGWPLSLLLFGFQPPTALFATISFVINIDES
jgi:hypothetical protein